MAAACTIVGIISSDTIQHYNQGKPSYEFLYEFWMNHQGCMCHYCQSLSNTGYPVISQPPDNSHHLIKLETSNRNFYLENEGLTKPSIHFKENQKLLMSDYPSLVAPGPLDLGNCYEKKTRNARQSFAMNVEDELELKCMRCGRLFKHQKRFATHTATCTGSAVCAVCCKSFTSSRSLSDHIRNVHSAQSHHCSQCDKDFSSRAGLTMHMKRVHTPADEQYSCTECDKMFGCKQSLKRHVLSHNVATAMKWNCHYCGTSFANFYNLKRHRLTQHVRKTLRCKECDLYFDTLQDWWNHIAETHPKKKHVCTECPLSFNKMKNMKRHALVHNTQKSFHCGLCDKSYKMKLSLEFHQLHRHLRQRAFSCAHCSRTFSRKCILQEHLRIHSPKTYHCQLDKCRRSFHTQYRLAVHVATQHHAYFVETRRLRAASTRERYKMIRESHYMQDRNTYNNSGYYTSYYYQHS